MPCVEAYVKGTRLQTTSFIQTYGVTTPLYRCTIKVYINIRQEYGIRVI